jgi:hypothetical protein
MVSIRADISLTSAIVIPDWPPMISVDTTPLIVTNGRASPAAFRRKCADGCMRC